MEPKTLQDVELSRVPASGSEDALIKLATEASVRCHALICSSQLHTGKAKFIFLLRFYTFYELLNGL